MYASWPSIWRDLGPSAFFATSDFCSSSKDPLGLRRCGAPRGSSSRGGTGSPGRPARAPGASAGPRRPCRSRASPRGAPRTCGGRRGSPGRPRAPARRALRGLGEAARAQEEHRRVLRLEAEVAGLPLQEGLEERGLLVELARAVVDAQETEPRRAVLGVLAQEALVDLLGLRESARPLERLAVEKEDGGSVRPVDDALERGDGLLRLLEPEEACASATAPWGSGGREVVRLLQLGGRFFEARPCPSRSRGAPARAAGARPRSAGTARRPCAPRARPPDRSGCRAGARRTRGGARRPSGSRSTALRNSLTAASNSLSWA